MNNQINTPNKQTNMANQVQSVVVFSCKVCQRVFKERRDLTTHQMTCSSSTGVSGGSFFATWRELGGTRRVPGEPADVGEKVALPDSQVGQNTQNAEGETGTNLTEKCTHCGRCFGTSRGLHQHQRSCNKEKGASKKPNRSAGSGSQDVAPVSAASEETSNNSSNGHPSQAATQQQQTSQLQTNEASSATRARHVWGNLTSEEVEREISEIYEKVVYWRKNLFKLPSGAAGKLYIQETTKLIMIWVEEKQLSAVALKMVMTMPALLLQKPTRKSTAKQHSEYLHRRLQHWKDGNFQALMQEGTAIQDKLKQQTRKDETRDHTAKVFAKLMLQGKVHAALRLLDKAASLGVAELTEQTMKALADLHPTAKPAAESTLLSGELPYFDPVIFSNIDEQAIAKAAMKTRGAAGPSGLDADGWRRILVSKNYGNIGKDLRTAIAKLTQRLCTHLMPVETSSSIEAYVANRLIPLLKAPTGIRPIGIGEVLRRIVGKAVVSEIKPEIMESAGCLQLCAGQKAGCEAAAHAMRDVFEEEQTDAVLFIDASNAFNSLNRAALLHNIGYLCAPMATYFKNCYQKPSRLFIAGGKELESAEGTTQGDPTAMPAYGVGILPFLALIRPEEEVGLVKQMAYADDIGGGARLAVLRQWWNNIEEHGPSFGYYPKASKSWLVVKEEKFDEAIQLFQNTGINITTEGRKYLGGFVGKDEATKQYVEELRDEWIVQLEELANIAKSEPQAAYSAFTAGFRHKMTYFIRTIPDLVEVLKPLDDVIDNKLIPAITEGQIISTADRKLLSLPVRLGGLGIPIYQEDCTREYENSRKVTQLLTPKIVAQEERYEHNREREREIEREIRQAREDSHQNKLESLRTQMSKAQLRANDIAQLKGASAWLTSLPLEEENFVLNKREFFDALALRFRWELKRLPINCLCNSPFNADHAMQCPLGGFVIRRHNRIRDLFAKILDEVTNEVRIEPPLQPITGETLNPGTLLDDDAHPDIAARGFWQQYEMAFFDVRVFNPFAKSHLSRNLDAVFRSNEAEKKTHYNDRVIRIEHGSFTPIVLSSFGGFGRESSQFLSKLVEKVAVKRGIEKGGVANYIRTKVAYELVRSQVACIRGSRSLWKKPVINTGDIELVNGSALITEN